MAQPAERMNVIDDPDATRSTIAIVPFSDALSLMEAIKWLLAAPQLAPLPTEGKRVVPELRVTSTGAAGHVQMVAFNRKADPDENVYGGPKDSALALIVFAGENRA